jgi:hypothetical protein
MRFQHLVESRRTGVATLPMPAKYRQLSETFKAVDMVRAIFFNRKEQITL